MDSWKRFDEKLLPDKEAFYISLNMEDVVDVDYRHVKRVYKEFNNKNICDYHYLYVQNNGLLLAEILENFRNKCIEIYELDPDHYAWQACLKKTAIKF